MITKGNNSSSMQSYSILDAIYHEKIRIMRKGSQVFIGLGLTIIYFYCIPSLFYPLYCIFSSCGTK